MSSTIHKTPNSTNKQSLFFNDISTPLTNRRTTTPAQPTSLWRQDFATSDLPPPPIFTLQDRSDFSPDSAFQDFRVGSPVHNYSNPSPVVTSSGWKNAGDDKEKTLGSGSGSGSGLGSGPGLGSGSGSGLGSGPGLGSGSGQGLGSGLGLGPGLDSDSGLGSGLDSDSGLGSGLDSGSGSGVGSPVDGVVQRRQPGVLLTLAAPREVARLEVEGNAVAAVGSVDEEEEWVTVYGFSPADTSLVLREFEKCGVILKHVPGPRESNWMHVLYQSRFDAQKALSKNGMQLNGALIIGVKPVDPMQRQSLSDRLHNQGFMPIPPPTTTRKTDPISFNASIQVHSQNGAPNAGGTIAIPAKSMVSKVVDLMFGS
ncbi:putative RNA-recognition motif (RRM) domain, nucleoporin, NUP53 [Helianthus annuus]|nr:putative RNA-recognition motif (RRM) domain, nucleoporin, NUP53 [Helianthus annuus]KAJ0458898.1 putative RNA-recognition motif (RRM) domain, nucleoporin, NUP53 [Helianthus annuus]